MQFASALKMVARGIQALSLLLTCPAKGAPQRKAFRFKLSPRWAFAAIHRASYILRLHLAG